jgi:hypothetical protein
VFGRGRFDSTAKGCPALRCRGLGWSPRFIDRRLLGMFALDMNKNVMIVLIVERLQEGVAYYSKLRHDDDVLVEFVNIGTFVIQKLPLFLSLSSFGIL